MNQLIKAESQLAVAANVSDNSTAMDYAEHHSRKYLSFKVAGETYGANIDNVKEIIEHISITRVPLTSAHIRGVSNLRGSVIPIIDLAVRLGKPIQALSKRSCIIFIELLYNDEIIDIGFVVDEVEEVMDIRSDRIELTPQFGTDIRSEFISGMGQVDGEFVILLSLDDVLSINELSELIVNEQYK